MLSPADIDRIAGDSGRRHDRLTEIGAREQFVFAAHRQHVRVAFFIGDVEMAAGGHR